MRQTAKSFAEFLARSSAVKFGDFTLKSGLKSNIFFNFGNICSGEETSELGRYFAKYIVENELHKVSALFGPAYKGIPLAIAASLALWRDFGMDMPFACNRKAEKTHGEKGRFIGFDLAKASSVVVIDDVITDGLTKHETIEMLAAFPHLHIVAFLVGVDRQDVDPAGKPWRERFESDTGIRVHALTTMEDVVRQRANNA
ncbi:MAG: orotate phosphoribosyltransferase [Beijerinckiaceae bacterium]|nr:orotate phosphoribosyltransferase [Beijerinckiaceae bacterium]